MSFATFLCCLMYICGNHDVLLRYFIRSEESFSYLNCCKIAFLNNARKKLRGVYLQPVHEMRSTV